MKNLSKITGLCLALLTLVATGMAWAGTPIPAPRVAYVYIGPPGVGGWTYQHDQGRLYMEKKLGLKADTVENVPEGADAERVIADLAQNHDVIFTTSFGYMDPTVNVPRSSPRLSFFTMPATKQLTTSAPILPKTGKLVIWPELPLERSPKRICWVMLRPSRFLS